MAPEQIVISPGPGRPENAGISVDVIRRFGPTTPILGVCLGHQAIGVRLRRHRLPRQRADARQDVDGRARRQGRLRRHRCAVSGGPLSLAGHRRRQACRRSWKWRRERRRTTRSWPCVIARYPVHGVQFHPESVLTDEGRRHLLRISWSSCDELFTGLLEKVVRHEDLTADEAAAAMREVMEGRAAPAALAALLVGARDEGRAAV